MAVRYSDARLQSSAISRALVIKALERIGGHDHHDEDREVRRQAAHVERLRAQVTEELGTHQDNQEDHSHGAASTAADDGPQCDEESVEEYEADASSSGSGDSHDSVTAALDPDGNADRLTHWVTPKHPGSLLHAVAEDTDGHDRMVAWCRRASSRAFAHGFVEGVGLSGAAALGREWCPVCADHLRAQGAQV